MPTAYLDHAASTPMRPDAVAAMVDVFGRVPGNPSGQHRWAREARRVLDDARDRIALAIGADPGEIVFTSGGTESDNLAVSGSVAAAGGRPICVATDHHAVLDPVGAAGGSTFGGHQARVTVEDLIAGLERAGSSSEGVPVSLVSMALVNNEIGAVAPVVDLAAAVRSHAPDASIHVDAVAAAMWMDLAPVVAAADLVSLSGHKVGGPKGIGALVVRSGTRLAPQLVGGSQERERRGGTQNVAGAAGLAVALEQCVVEREAVAARVARMRDRLLEGLLSELHAEVVDTVAFTGGAQRVANIIHLSCWGVHRDALLFRLDQDGLAVSAGSSCASGAVERSHVVEALGLPAGLRDGALRLSLGWTTTDAEIDHALAIIPAAVRDLRGTAAEGSAA